MFSSNNTRALQALLKARLDPDTMAVMLEHLDKDPVDSLRKDATGVGSRGEHSNDRR